MVFYALKHHIVEMRGGVTDAGQTTNEEEEELKIELLSQWKLEAESRKFAELPQWLGLSPLALTELLNSPPKHQKITNFSGACWCLVLHEYVRRDVSVFPDGNYMCQS